jgi:DNA-binding NarL/FixJ family response regulator
MYSILVIDDDSSYRNMMETILLMEGFDVRVASNGQSALLMLREKRPNLILCDIMMPEMDGYRVLDIINGENALSHIPFVFVTALDGRREVRRGMSAGADDYLAKPFSADELLAAVTGRIRRHERITSHHGNAVFHNEQAILRTKITVREKEVLLMVGQGATSKEIAERLGISMKTVEVHRANLMKKLAAANAACLARWAVIAEQMVRDSDDAS